MKGREAVDARGCSAGGRVRDDYFCQDESSLPFLEARLKPRCHGFETLNLLAESGATSCVGPLRLCVGHRKQTWLLHLRVYLKLFEKF
jgi:hypothetical protein